MHCFNDRVREVPKISLDIILGRYFEIMTRLGTIRKTSLGFNNRDPIVEAMHSEFSGRNRSVDFISTSVNEGYYMKMFWNFPEPIVEVNSVVRHFRPRQV
jgi:hypothetical protein